MLGWPRKGESGVWAHRNHALVWVRLLPIIVAGGPERQDNFVVALCPQGAVLEQRL